MTAIQNTMEDGRNAVWVIERERGWGREKERGREWKGGSERVVSVVVVALLIRLAAVVGH